MNKVILFSTRYISNPTCVFKFIKENAALSNALCDYFKKNNKEELKAMKRDLKTKYASSGEPIDLDLKNKIEREIEISARKEKRWDADYAKKCGKQKAIKRLNNTIDPNSELGQKISGYLNIIDDPSFTTEDFNKYSDIKINLNIDGYSGQILKDRVTLFNVGDNDGEYRIYAVWSLGDKPEKLDNKDENAIMNSKWVETLTMAVAEEVNDDFELLLILHDKDFNSLPQSDVFRSVYNKKELNINNKNGKNIKASHSLTIFQHPQPEFNEIIELSSSITPQNVGEQLWDRADRIVRQTRIFQSLKDLQDDIYNSNLNSKAYKELESLLSSKEYNGLRQGFKLMKGDDKSVKEVVDEINSSIDNKISNNCCSELKSIFQSEEFDKTACLKKVIELKVSNSNEYSEINKLLAPLTAHCLGKGSLKYYLISEINEHLKLRMTNGTDNK